MDITIKKIKVGKGKLVFEYDKKEDEESLISTHTSKFEEEPEPEFWRIFGLLSVDVCKILEVDPGQLAERMIPTGVSYSTDGSGYEGAIITCEYRMPQEAVLYLEGHRGQGSLFDDEDREPRNVTPEDSPTRLVAITGGSIKQIAG